MNSNYRPSGNPTARRSVDGFVSVPGRQSQFGQSSQTQTNPRSGQTYPSPSQYHQYNRPSPSNQQSGTYRQSQPNQNPTAPQFSRPPMPSLSQVVSHQQANHQFASINSYQPPRDPQTNPHYTQSQSAQVTDPSPSLNSSIFPQHARIYTNGYESNQTQPEPVPEPQPTPQLVSKPTPAQYQAGYNSNYSQSNQQSNQYQQNYQQSSPSFNQQPQNFGQSNHSGTMGQSVIGSGSSISGAILSSSAPMMKPHTSNEESSDNYSEMNRADNVSSMHAINQLGDNPKNSKFFPTTASSLKIRPIPNTVKYNSWFSLEWIIDTFKGFFGNSYKE